VRRSCGILVHPTSFPGRYGIGDLGDGATRFIDFLESAGQSLWQILPLGPTGYGDSPYQSFSTFAGNFYLISPDEWVTQGYLTSGDLYDVPWFDPRCVDYGPMIEYKMSICKKAFDRFLSHATRAQKSGYARFCDRNEYWLDDYALFTSLKNHFRGAVWNKWPTAIAERKDEAMAEYTAMLEEEISFYKFLQYEFFRQWEGIKKYANEKDISIVGDLPIYVSMDSADVWANPGLFLIDGDLQPTAVAGVPPDYFAEDGQLWGNPLYNWDEHGKTGYAWWIKRIAAVLRTVDIVRIDHFRGFESYWAVPYKAVTAKKGKWVKGPGLELFTAIKGHFGCLPIIAEDLGIITDEVRELRDLAGLPGMKVLQFAFEPNAQGLYAPHNYSDTHCVVYTGTHDNDTTLGWYEKAEEKERDYYRRYMNVTGETVAWDLIRLAYASIAVYAIAPVQDIMELGSDSRMNKPGVPDGNWRFRYTQDMLTDEMAEHLLYLAKLYNRCVLPSCFIARTLF